jgi:enoyl-CoA hydratase/carnithine racemase
LPKSVSKAPGALSAAFIFLAVESQPHVGEEKAIALTEECHPIGTSEAKAIGFIDDSFGDGIAEFEEILMSRALKLAQQEFLAAPARKAREAPE